MTIATIRTINDWVKEITEWGDEKGFADTARDLPLALALVHSEVSEVLEAWRRRKANFYIVEGNKPEGIGIELADIVIRVMHICGAMGINLEDMMERKMAYNETRPYKHGDLRA